jgi:hypothetical protein
MQERALQRKGLTGPMVVASWFILGAFRCNQ